MKDIKQYRRYIDLFFRSAGLKRSSTSTFEATPPKQPYNGSVSTPTPDYTTVSPVITEQGSSGLKTDKSKLYELAQKNKLVAPKYDTVHVGNGFVTTITFNGRQFKSSKVCSKKKEAEQDAATVALAVVTGKLMLTDVQRQESERGYFLVFIIPYYILIQCTLDKWNLQRELNFFFIYSNKVTGCQI